MPAANFEFPDEAHWKKLDAWLDELLDLDAKQRERRLHVIAAEAPDLLPTLQRLLEIADRADAFDRLLEQALRFLIDQQTRH